MEYKNLIELSQQFARHAGITHWAVSMRIFGKGDFFKKLGDGHDCQVKTANRALNWFDHNWPDDDLEWPNSVPRPSKSEDAA